MVLLSHSTFLHINMDTEKITWQEYEHQPLEREADWFWALGIIAVTSAVTAFILENVLFGILILLAGGTIGILARREPSLVTFTLDRDGLSVNGTLYPMKDLRAFWISESETADNNEFLLLIDTPRFMTPDLAIPITQVNPETVHMWFISNEIPEQELRESFALKFLEIFGF